MFQFDSAPSRNSPQIEAIQLASHEWEIARAHLATAISSYLAKCSALDTVCTRRGYYPPERAAVEDSLVAVDSELSSLSSELQSLRDSQVSLSTLRNKSGRLTYINALPIEVLSYIFRLSTASTCCLRDPKSKGCYDALAAVDVYWRETVLNMPELWTHIDISPDTPTRSLYDQARTRIARAKNEPLHIHIFEPAKSFFGGSTPGIEINKLRSFLVPYSSRSVSLELDSEARGGHFVSIMMTVWASARATPLVDLRVRSHHSHEDTQHEPYFDGIHHLNTPPKTRFSLHTLHLQNFTARAESTIFDGLVDLRLECTNSGYSASSLWNLHIILQRCPKLEILKLGGFDIQTMYHPPPLPIVLENLKVLSLARLESKSLENVLSVISQPNISAQLSVGLTFYQDEMRDVYEAFFSRCHISTLYYQSSAEYLDLHQLPSVHDHLIIFQSNISDNHETRPNLRVRCLTLVSCVITIESLVLLVIELGVQVLKLDCCLMDHLMDAEGVVQGVSDEGMVGLLDACPGVTCAISDVDTTLNLPCRSMLDRA